MKLRQFGGFLRFWLAQTSSDFGRYFSTLALQVVVVITLHGSALDLGLVNAARWLPYVFLGLLAGALVDRTSRKHILIATNVISGVLLTAICVLAVLGRLDIVWLIAMILLFGSVTLFHDAAGQSTLPQLVPKPLLVHANVRLEQSAAAAQATGPAIAGALIGWFGAPIALLTDAAAQFVSGALTASIPYPPTTDRPREHGIGKAISDGLRWLYSHPALRSLALNTNAWFLFHAMLGAVLAPFVLRDLGLSPLALGGVLALSGIGALMGTASSARLSTQWGIGPTIGAARLLYAPSLVLLALASLAAHRAPDVPPILLVGAGQLLYGLAMGIEGPLEMAYRQGVTPGAMLGRTNATMRSTNRAMVVVGAPVGGALADAYGFTAVFWLASAGMTLVAAWYLASPMWRVPRDAGEAMHLVD